jgi:hypothetical protein
VSYRPEFEGYALVQLNGLPKAAFDAFDAFVERIAVLVLEPRDAAVVPPANDPAIRRTLSGAGYGLLSFRSDEAAQVIRMHDIRWVG